MGAGPDTRNAVDRPDGFVRRFDRALENRVVMLFTAAVLAATGSLGINSVTPQVRSDPATGTMLNEAVESLGEDIAAVHKAADLRLGKLERMQALDDQHRIDAANGYERIRSLETNIARQTQAVENMREALREIRDEMREWARAQR